MSDSTFRALCAELLQPLAEFDDADPYHDNLPLINRASAALAQPELVALTDEKLTLVYAYAVAAAVDNKRGPLKPEDVEAAQAAGLRAVLARWGTPATQPEPVAVARPEDEYHEDMGAVLWWYFPFVERPYCGSPLDSEWPGYHTHFTPLGPMPTPANNTREATNG